MGGKAKLVTWEKDGKHGVGLDLVADTVAAARPKPPEKRQGDTNHKPYAGGYPPRDDSRPFDDPITF